MTFSVLHVSLVSQHVDSGEIYAYGIYSCICKLQELRTTDVQVVIDSFVSVIHTKFAFGVVAEDFTGDSIYISLPKNQCL
jgi:hypothetical protein